MVTKRQREILIGTILGDGYLQATGKRNARLKLEHSERQRDYLRWKYEALQSLMQDQPKTVERFNPQWKRHYTYCRCQTVAMPLLGRYKRTFYDENGRKQIPLNIEGLLKAPLTLAVWFMDDGHYYPRDKVAYIYLPRYTDEELTRLVNALERNFGLSCRVVRKKGYPCLFFPPDVTQKLKDIISPWVLPSMRYKLPPDPVTTEGALPESPVIEVQS
jgi:hypothetical protein